MTEYYTTSSLVHAAAAIEQGFDGCLSCLYDDVTEEWSYYEGLLLNGWLDRGQEITEWRFPKTPHNVALEILVIGDYGGDGKYSGFVRHVTDDRVIIAMPDHERAIPIHDFVIEKRNINGKPVPMPVWDKEGV